MLPDRVIQDSDNEDDALSDVPTSIDPLQEQSVQGSRRSSLADSINGERRYDAESGQLPPTQSDSPLAVNFDVFLRSPSQGMGAPELTSSQRRREERWIPAEVGSGSVGECSPL